MMFLVSTVVDGYGWLWKN